MTIKSALNLQKQIMNFRLHDLLFFRNFSTKTSYIVLNKRSKNDSKSYVYTSPTLKKKLYFSKRINYDDLKIISIVVYIWNLYNISVDIILKRSSITLKAPYLVCTQVNNRKKNIILSRVIQLVTSYKINYCLNVALCQHSAYC